MVSRDNRRAEHDNGQAGDARGILRRVLRLPTFFKILIANSAIVTVGAVLGTVITVLHVQWYPEDLHYELVALFAAVGLATSYAVNYLALKLALKPLDRLQEAVNQVRSGRLDVTVKAGDLSDEQFDKLIDTFNQMMIKLEQDAQQLHRLSGAILQAQEEERQRVARELHDETAQSLTSLLVRLRLLERTQNSEEAQKHVQELRRLTAQALEEVRHVALELRPKILDDLGLDAALGWRVDELNATRGARATLQISGIDKRLPRDIELVLYRVAQEALTNVVRHAQANHVLLCLKQADGWLTLEIADDGVGVDASATLCHRAERGQHGSRGLGVLGMKERMALIGGTLTIESRAGNGTRLIARAPPPP